MIKKKMTGGFILFLGFMWLCTLISKSFYTTKLPVVTTSVLEEKYIEHIVEADGIVVEGGKQAVTTLAGLRVESLMVHVGDRVEEGDVLFKIDLDDLKEIMKENQTQIDKLQLQVNAILENQELARQKKEIEEARAREDYDRTAREKNTDVGRAADVYARTMEELEGADDEAGYQELEDALQQAAYGEADAMRERDSAMRQAQRDIEDILFPEASDATLSVTRTDIGRLKENLSSYQKIMDNQGNVTADASGMITDIYIEAGSRVPDSAAMMMTDDSIPCQFKVLLDKEQKKYVGFGDEVSLKLDGSRQKMDMHIDYFSESRTMPGSFETYIALPEGTGVPGLSGTITRSETGEKYNYCISPLAIHRGENNIAIVYVLKEREGILGREYYVEEVNVKILDENDRWAAVESPSLDRESKIIVSSDKEFAKGDVVRWVE